MTPIFTEQQKREYAQKCDHEIDWIKVTHSDLYKPWCVNHSVQVQGHGEHYTNPTIGQWIPYNVVMLHDKRLPPPYTILSSGSVRCKTMT